MNKYFSLIIALGLTLGCAHDTIYEEIKVDEHGISPTKLSDRVQHFEIKNKSLLEAITTEIPQFKNMNMGFVFYDYNTERQIQAHKKISLTMTDSAVEEILTALTKADTSYYWIADGDVINYLPRVRLKNTSDSVKILESKLPIFEVRDVEMYQAVAALVIQARAFGISGIAPKTYPKYSVDQDPNLIAQYEKISLTLRNKSIRECLNAIVAADPASAWRAIPHPKGLVLSANPRHSHGYKRIPRAP